MNSTTKYGLTLAATATAFALAVGGTSVAVGEITSKDIKDHSIKIKDLNAGAVAKLKGQQGPAGPSGPAGAAGPAGADAGPGVGQGSTTGAVVANVTTSATSPGANAQTGLVSVPAEQASEFTVAKGVPLISVNLPAGHYIVSGTALFFAFGASSDQFGEARLFTANGTAQGSSIFAPEIPPAALGGVASQTGASVEITLASATTITLRARVRDTAGGASTVQAGANLLVTNAD
jgi:hypothetical protein